MHLSLTGLASRSRVDNPPPPNSPTPTGQELSIKLKLTVNLRRAVQLYIVTAQAHFLLE